MEELARITRRRLEDVDFAGHYSASSAWRRRAGDCTEDAVLLAALARAAGIPALVASGMVYTRERYHQASDAFIPHSWVVAYLDGEWRSVDMTLGAFDSTHVALTLGEGDAQSVAGSYFIAGLIEWQEMVEVRPRPAD
jgi:transglutaminase/protease-like cytokinesis protein 3